MKSDRIIGLDIIRAIAIIIVVVFHASPILSSLGTIPHIGGYIHKILVLCAPFGLLGVELFFALSGYLIGSILIKMYVRSGKFEFAEIRSFLIRRWFRTLPNYWLILIINILLCLVLNPHSLSVTILQYFVFIQNLFYEHPSFFPESWSLAVEEWSYLTLPVVLFLISFCFKKLSKQQKVFITFTLYATTFLFLRLLLADNNNTDPWYFDRGLRKIVFFRLDAIIYGFLIAYLHVFHNERLMKAKKMLLNVSIAGTIFMIGAYYVSIHPHFQFYPKYKGFRFFYNVFMLALIPFFFSLAIPYASTVKEIRNKKLSAVITTISKISYSMYLVHFSLVYVPFFQFAKYTKYNCIPLYLLFWAIVISISLIIYRFFELPVMNLRQSITKEDPKV